MSFFDKWKKIGVNLFSNTKINSLDIIKESHNRTEEELSDVALTPLEEIGKESKRIPKVLLREQQLKKDHDLFSVDGHAIDAFMQENRHAENLIKEIKRKFRKVERFNFEVHWKDLILLLNELKSIEIHFRRKEELLFPQLQNEKLGLLSENFTALHTAILKNIRNMIQAASTKNIKNFKTLFNQTCSMIHEGILKEERMLFPSALSQLNETQWKKIREQSKEIGYCWIEQIKDELVLRMEHEKNKLDGFRLETGFLPIGLIDKTFNALPCEITVVNADNKIVYYNCKDSRIFKRKTSFIGERFEDCHTGKNEKTVKKIISAFKKEKSEMFELWFNIENHKIYVQYKPFYDDEERYIGFIEIAMNISYYRLLEGEKINILN